MTDQNKLKSFSNVLVMVTSPIINSTGRLWERKKVNKGAD